MESYTLTRQDAADLLEISVRSVDRYVKSWKIRSEKRWKSVYVNNDDVNNIHCNTETAPIIINNWGEKNNTQFESKKITKKDDYDKITKTFENIYTDLRTQIEKKDKVIQDMSIEIWVSREQVKQSISVSEHNRSQMLLEESKTHISKQMNDLSEEKKKLQKDLKDEKFDKKVLITFVFILLAVSAYFWFKTI